jgi:hypothetical protein
MLFWAGFLAMICLWPRRVVTLNRFLKSEKIRYAWEPTFSAGLFIERASLCQALEALKSVI